MKNHLQDGSFITVGIIAGGDINDPASDHSCNQKVILPLVHNPDGVKPEHLAFSTLSQSPQKHSQTSFPGVLDPGYLVYVMKRPGDNQVVILGVANDLHNSDNRTPGNIDLLGHSFFKELMDKTIKINIPPDIQEGEDRGAKVRKIKEKDKEWSHNLLKGLPTHGSLFSLAGFRLPELKDIPTAKQHFNGILTQDMLNNLPGQVMSLGKMFNSLFGNKSMSNAALGGLPPQMQNAVQSFGNLAQNLEANEYGSFGVSGRVDANTYMNNAVSLISQITTIDDLVTVMNRLQYDETLFGQENLDCLEYEIEGTFGTLKQLVCANGNVVVFYANTANTAPVNQQNDFQNAMNSPSMAPGVTQDSNMFGKSANTMMDMLKRIAPESEKKGVELSKKVNMESTAQKLNEIVKKLVKGGNPLDPSLFQ